MEKLTSNGVNPWFWSKNGHFSNIFYFRKYTPEKCLLPYSRVEKRLSRVWKQEFQKREKFTFFQRGRPMISGPKMAMFSTFFLGNLGQKNVFYDILKWKNAFLGYKKKKFKKWKKWHFSKKVNLWFWSKNGHFWNFFFRKYTPEKCLLGYSRAKKRVSRL